MGNRTMAVRYARALVDVLSRDEDLRRVEEDLAGIRSVLEEHPELRGVLIAAGLPPARRRKVAERLAGAVAMHPATERLMILLAERGQSTLVDEIHEALMALADERRRIVPAEVTTAVEIAAGKEESYRRSLERLTGKTVRLRLRVDPSILGGVVTRIGSEVYDGSLRGRLERLRERMKGE
jgi:F-type H+-transporting ATPase subunit delta